MATDAPAPSPALSPAQRSKVRRLARPHEAEAGDAAGELNVVPYLDIITNLMMFVLVGASAAFVSTIGVQAALANPHLGPGTSAALRLTAMITSEGVSLTTSAGHVAPGCAAAPSPPAVGPGVTVPRGASGHDLGALAACARRVKSARPAFAEETEVAITASGDVPYDVVVSVIDALRFDAEGPLFPDVAFGVVR